MSCLLRESSLGLAEGRAGMDEGEQRNQGAADAPALFRDIGVIHAARRCVNWARAVERGLRESAAVGEVASWVTWTRRLATDVTADRDRAREEDAHWLADRCAAFARELEQRIPAEIKNR